MATYPNSVKETGEMLKTGQVQRMEDCRMISLSEEALKVYELAIDISFGLIICTLCGYAIATKNLITHRKQKHQKSDIGYELCERLGHINEQLPVDYIDITRQPLAPIKNIAVCSGFSCAICIYYCPAKESMRRHYWSFHQGIDHSTATTCYIQSIYGNHRRKYFSVSISDSGEIDDKRPIVEKSANVEAKALVAIENLLLNSCPPSITVLKDARHEDTFQNLMNWDQWIPNVNLDFIINLCSIPVTNKLYTTQISEAVLYYLEHVQTLFYSKDYRLRRLLASRNGIDIPTFGFSPLQEKSSVIKYAREISRFVNFLIQCQNCQLQQHLRVPGLPNLLSSICNSIFSFENALKDSTIIASKITNDLLHAVLLPCFAKKHSPLSSAMESEAFAFMVLSSLRNDGSFCSASEISPKAAILQRWTRSVVMKEILRVDTPASLDTWLPYIHDTGQNVFSLICDASRLAFTIISGQDRLPTIIWQDTSFTTLTIGHCTISVIELQDMVNKLLTDAKMILLEEILLNMPIPAALKKLLDTKSGNGKVIVDDLHNKAVGYSFLSDARNHFDAYRGHLLRYIVSSHNIQLAFLSLVTDEIHWNIARIRTWMKSVDKFRKLMVILVHLTAGQPA